MPDLFKDVGAFHRKFELPSWPTAPGPALPSMDVVEFRVGFLREELRELIVAFSRDDLPGAADALVDLVYVALGTAHLMGLPFNALWTEVQRANLAKERAAGAADPRSRRGHALDVVKPPGWQPPDVAGVLRAHGWKGQAP